MRPGSTARHASLLGLALLAGSVSCKTPAQITVYVRGIGFVCSQAEGEVWGEGAEVVAQSSLDELGLEGARATRCIDVFGTEPPRVSYGRVVLLPEGGGAGPVEVLVIGALGSSLGSPGTTSLEACRGFYASADGLRDEGCLANPECARCIFSRRSLGFVDETQLTLQIELTNDCAGVLCAETQTCVSGGCVDATTECPEGTCDLVNDGVGGADGAGGEGGAGGQGGAGGEGGAGGQGDVWVEYPPHDAPFAQVKDLSALRDGAALRVFVATGPSLYVYEGGVPGDTWEGGALERFHALARPASGSDLVVALGPAGMTTNLGAPPFEGPEPPPQAVWGAPPATATFRAAALLGLNPTDLAWVVISQFAARGGHGGFSGTGDSGSGGVFASPIGGGSQVVVMGLGSTLFRFDSGVQSSLPTQPSGVHHVWGGAAGEGALFAVFGATTAEGTMFNLSSQSYTLAEVGDPTGTLIHDLFGDADTASGEVRVWVIGSLDGASWLGAASTVAGVLEPWQRYALPEGVTDPDDLTTLWSDGVDLVVAGASGVYQATIADLQPLP